MALKDTWKKTGKSIGGAFKNFGKAMATTAKIAVGSEENDVQESGKTRLRESWTNVGHGFGDAGKNIGKAAQGTAQKVVGEDEEKKEEKEKDVKPSEEEVIDVDSKMSEEYK